jgi:hypothetical protein
MLVSPRWGITDAAAAPTPEPRGHISFASNPPDNNCWYNDIVRMQNAGFTLLTT